MKELKEINWTSLLIGATLGAGAYYLYQKYAVKSSEKAQEKKPLRV